MAPEGSRREFLAGSAALLLGSSIRAIGAEGADPWGGWKVGAQSYTWRQFSFEQALERMKKLDLRYLECYPGHVPVESTDAQLQAVAKLCKEYNVTPFASGVYPFSKDTDKNRVYFEFARKLGLKVLSADPAVNAFDSLDKLCDEYKIAIAIHPHGPIGTKLHHWYSAEVIMEAVKDHHPLIGSCLDTGHLIRSAQPPFGKKLDPAEQIRVMGSRNFGLHMKDHDNEKREDVIFGEGVLDVPGILKALREVKFTGMISVEYEAKPEEPTADVKECLQVVKKAASIIQAV
ncbi:sugar phosphate isomerase/epimerase [bacterium]|jgi:inosose dehydratase|nr:sugar phosphate isomerase/epimerase [bacterium]